MAHDLQLSGYLGKEGTYELLSWYYFWLKMIDLVKRFIGTYYGYKCAKAFNTKY